MAVRKIRINEDYNSSDEISTLVNFVTINSFDVKELFDIINNQLLQSFYKYDINVNYHFTYKGHMIILELPGLSDNYDKVLFTIDFDGNNHRFVISEYVHKIGKSEAYAELIAKYPSFDSLAKEIDKLVQSLLRKR